MLQLLVLHGADLLQLRPNSVDWKQSIVSIGLLKEKKGDAASAHCKRKQGKLCVSV
jgi:hypothetical protein